jgi:hypothetical protein
MQGKQILSSITGYHDKESTPMYAHAFTMLSLSSIRFKRDLAYSSTVMVLFLSRSSTWVAVKRYDVLDATIVNGAWAEDGREGYKGADRKGGGESVRWQTMD